MRPLNLLDAGTAIRRFGLRVAFWALGFAVLGYGASFLIPPRYQATSVILPPDEDELTSALSISRRGMSGFGALGRLGGQYFTQADVALATLNSRNVHERVVKEFDLQKVYRTKKLEDAISELKDRTTVRIATDGTIAVTVSDRDAKRSADMANAFMTNLDELNRMFRTSRARRTRRFLEGRLTEADSSLRASERSLARYQGQKGTVVLTTESRGAADAGASLMAQKVSAEVELQILRTYASPQSDEVQRLQSIVRELSRQIGELPATQVGGASLVRQVAVQQQVVALLTTQLEEARLREVLDTPTIQILDAAHPPTRRTWPRRTWIALFGFLLGAGLGVLSVTRRLPLLSRA